MNIRNGFPDPHAKAKQDAPHDTVELDLTRIAQVLWHGRRAIAVLGVMGTLLAGLYAYGVARPKFAATALLVQTDQSAPLQGAGLIPALNDPSDLNTELQIIQSHGLIRRLVHALELHKDAEFNPSLRSSLPAIADAKTDPDMTEQIVRRVQDAVSAHVQRNTRIMAITARSEDRDKAARIANALSEVYLVDQVEAKFQTADDAVGWLSDRVGDLKQDLSEQEQAVARQRTQMGSATKESLDALNERLNEARTRLDDLRSRPTDAAEEDQRLALQRAALEQSIEKLETSIAKQGADLTALQQLEREAQATRVLYETLLARLKEASAIRGLQQADARVLAAATAGVYVSPQKPLILASGGLLGMILAALFVMFRQIAYSGFRTAGELEQAVGKPVLGQIPRLPLADRGALLPFLSGHPTAAVVEAIRNLRTSLLLSTVDTPPQVVLIASAMPGEGKTTQAIALAQSLAGLGKRILLVEGDIRRRALDQYVPDRPGPGILSVLSGTCSLAQAVQPVAGLGVDVLFGEQAPASPADLFASHRFERLMHEARGQYDMVIMDTPPVLVVPDGRVIARHADAVLFMVAWNKTTRHQVLEGVRQFERVGCPVTGLVLSQIRPEDLARLGHGDSYPAYAAYGEGYYDAG